MQTKMHDNALCEGKGSNMKIRKRIGQSLAYFLMVTILLQMCMVTNGVVSAKTDHTVDYYKELLSDVNSNEIKFKDYVAMYDENKRPNLQYEIDAADYVRVEGMDVTEYENYQGMEGTSVYTDERGLIEYEVNIEEEGFYDISLLYYPVEGKSASMQRGIFIDGALPYKQLNLIELSRIWVNEVDTWEQDNRGNDLKPKQVEEPQWINSYIYDSEGYETDKLSVYLTTGLHTITIYSRREPLILRKIILNNAHEVEPYETVKSKQDQSGEVETKDLIYTVQAEAADRKSSQMLYPSQDKSSPAIFPYSVKELKNNTIGNNSNWRIIGQWLEWDFDVEESGYYNITLHAKQNFVRGIYTSRKITIDGVVPFQELSGYKFRYADNWGLRTLKDEEGNHFRFFLEKGKHTIRMEVVLGEFSEIVSDAQDVLMDLNAIYRKVIRITGVAPDEYRDYHIEKNVSGIKEDLAAVRADLADVVSRLKETAGASSNREAVLVSMVEQLDYLLKDVERFPRALAAYKTDTSAIGTWITSVLEQPLALDAIYVHSSNVKAPEANNSFWARLLHTVKTLFYSFIIDYNTIGNVAEEGEESKNITVWIGAGRDQANVLKEMIDETFTPENNINVNVQLVDMGTLLQATLAGQGPDVAVQVGGDLPMNYGMRGAVVDLQTFADLDEVKTRFRASGMLPYEFDNHTFALPETETCLMMFYRKDILDELGLKVPETWDDMKVALSVLSKNQMDLGMLPLTEQVYAMLLYQNGGAYYTEDAMASALDSDIAIRTFKDYCAYYTDYKLEREAPVDQRFRTGEAPIIISDFTLYNQLQVSAPDIKGLWGFTKVPGTVKEDGTIDHSVSSGGSATIMMESSKEKETAWEFMKWWTSTDTQIKYGREMEALMGAAARYPTANVKAFESLPWPTEDYEALKEQFQWMKGIPQVPGGYFSWRNINNAFYKVVIAEDKMKKQPREALTDYVRFINEEINFKRIEFGLPIAKE